MQVQQYISERLKVLKMLYRELRENAGYSQKAVAEFLGCARSRIVEIEKLDKTTFYTIGEIEILASLFGRNLLDIFRMTDQDAIDLGRIVTATQTRVALLEVVDCILPPQFRLLYTDAEFIPDQLEFSHEGDILASIIDYHNALDWKNMPLPDPPSLSVLCWNTRTGEVIGELRLPYIEHIALLDSERVAVATSRPLRYVQDIRHYEGEYRLLIWNIRTDTVEREIQLLDRVGNFAVSNDGTYLAAFFPTTTTIQIWQMTDFSVIHAYEMEAPPNDIQSLDSVRFARDVQQLPRKRKFGPGYGDYKAERFEFIPPGNILVFGYGAWTTELDMNRNDGGMVQPSAQYPRLPCHRLAHVRDENREIAVTSLDYIASTRESQVNLSYVVAGESSESSLDLVRRYLGIVGQPIIIDDGCVLAQVLYKTSYKWGVWPKDLLGLVNLITGRVVLLDDHGRLQDGDFPIVARIAPRGNAVAYWVYPNDKNMVARLAIQFIDTTPLRVKGIMTLTRFWGVEEEKYGKLSRGGSNGQISTNVYERIQAASSEVV